MFIKIQMFSVSKQEEEMMAPKVKRLQLHNMRL